MPIYQVICRSAYLSADIADMPIWRYEKMISAICRYFYQQYICRIYRPIFLSVALKELLKKFPQPHTAPSQFRKGSWLTNNNNGWAIYFLLISLALAQKLRSWYRIVKAARESETRRYHYSKMVSKETSQGEWNLVFEDHKVVLAITCLGSLFLGILLAINAFSHLKVRQ